jgi:NitT/TauT family transport system substrate-binding protein
VNRAFGWVCAALACTVFGCSRPAVKSSSSALPIKFATDWRAEAEQGGFYEALANGEYAKRGLDVTILPGGPGVNVPQLVAAGAAQIGVGSNSFIVMNLAAQAVPVKAVAAFMQKDPQVLIAHPGAGVKTPADLKGHPVLLSDASISAFWVWLKAKYGLSDSQVRKYNSNSGPFLADPRVIQQGYITSEPYTIEKQAHFKPVVMLLADYGYPGYADLVLVGDSFSAKHPEAVRAFVAASRAGWKEYIDGDPRPGDALILKSNPEMTEDVLSQARDKMRSAGIVGADPGRMTDARWNDFYQMASGQGVYPKTLDYHRAYTLQFQPPAP